MKEYAEIKVERFRKRFQRQYGDGHYFFACHAAFPIAFSVDMLYQLWANFKEVPAKVVQKAESPFPIWSQKMNRLAVSDLLQSDLVRRTDRDLFEMETVVRAYLLKKLKTYYSEEQLNKLARFSYQYVDQRINDPYYRAFRDTQRWVSLARLAPEKAAEQLTAYYNLMLEKDNASELVRLDGILEALTLMDARFADLSAFSKAIRATYTDQSEEEKLSEARESLKKVVRIQQDLASKAGGLKVKLHENLKRQTFEFKKEISEETDLLDHRLEQSEAQGSTHLNLSNLGLTSIPKEILERRGLETLDLSNNQLSELPLEISNWVNLRRLILDNNQIEELPDDLKGLLFVEELYLKNNRLDFLPSWILDFANLQKLDLRGNPVGNIRKDKLLFEKPADFERLNRQFYPRSAGYQQPMVMILITDPYERGLIQRALEPAVDAGLLHIEIPESNQSWQLFRLFRQFRSQICFLHVNGSQTADQFTLNVGYQSFSMSLRLWNGIVNSTNQGKVCFIGGGTGKRVVGDILQTAFEACIYSTDFQGEDDDVRENFVSVFYESLANGRTLGEAYDQATQELGGGPIQQVQQKSAPSFSSDRFIIEVRGTSVMEWRLLEEAIPSSFVDLETLKAWLMELLLQGWPGSLFTPLRGMLLRDSEQFRQLNALQNEWEQFQSEEARRAFWDSEKSPMQEFIRSISEEDLVEGLLEVPAAEEEGDENDQAVEEEEELDDEKESNPTEFSKEYFDSLRELVANNQVEKALERLLALSLNSAYTNRIYELQQSYKKIIQDQNLFLTTEEGSNSRLNQVNINLLEIIREVQEDTIKNVPGKDDAKLSKEQADEIRNLVSKDELRTALDISQEWVEADPRYHDQIINLKARYQRLTQNKALDIITPENFNSEMSRLAASLLALVGELEDKGELKRKRRRSRRDNNEAIELIKKLILNSQLDQAFEEFASLTMPSHLNKDLIFLKGRYEDLQIKWRQGVIAYEEYQVELNRITEGILQLLKEIESDSDRSKKTAQTDYVSQDNLYAKVRELLNNNKIEEAIQRLKREIRRNSEWYNEVLILESRHNRLQKGYEAGVVFEENYSVERQKLLYNILELLNELAKSDEQSWHSKSKSDGESSGGGLFSRIRRLFTGSSKEALLSPSQADNIRSLLAQANIEEALGILIKVEGLDRKKKSQIIELLSQYQKFHNERLTSTTSEGGQSSAINSIVVAILELVDKISEK